MLGSVRPQRRADGFTLVELLVAMIIIGVLAAVAVPVLLNQRARARETAVQSDIKTITKEIVAYYVNGRAPLDLREDLGTRTWQLTADAAVVAEGPLSAGNSVSSRTHITSDSDYCVALLPADNAARVWRATPEGLAALDC